jgi:hypothetical protein
MVEDPRRTVTLTLPYEEATMLLAGAEIGLDGAEENLDPIDFATLEAGVEKLRAAIEPSAAPTVPPKTYEAFSASGHLVHVTIPEKA